MPHGQKNEMATRLVSNFVLLSLGSGNGTAAVSDGKATLEEPVHSFTGVANEFMVFHQLL